MSDNIVIKDALSIYNRFDNVHNFEQMRVTIASPEQILSWSNGVVKRPETINYRTFKPERDGLFCARIFGPIRDYECLCGKYKRIKYKGIICEKCGVEVTKASVRRERMAHIDLVSPVAHIWFLYLPPSRIGTLLGMSVREVERVLYFESYAVLENGNTPFEVGQVLSEAEYSDAIDAYGESSFKVCMGAEAIMKLLEKIDLQSEKEKLQAALLSTKSEMKKKTIIKKLKLVEDFITSGNRPEWMILTRIPVLPPEIRPLVMLDGGRFAASDLNELYRRVINRNNRLQRLMELEAPEMIIRNEKRMLQESVDALLDNSRKARPSRNSNGRDFKSLSDMLKGKQGRFRQNLLGKRVDYSGRSVIVVGPELKLHQCGLPKKMALELFKPFLYSKLELYGKANSIKMAKKIVESEKPEVWAMLEEIIREHPVLLNRAPTLHRLGIQAFEPKLIESKAIQLHPLVCTSFNADFDGDQMAVHVPLSIEAQMEARVLMLSSNNILSPASGKPTIVPTQDIILGLYYMSLAMDGEPGEGKIFCSQNEIETAILNGVITINTKIKYCFKYSDSNDKELKNKLNVVETNPGCVMIYNLLPMDGKVKFEDVNIPMTKKAISSTIDLVHRSYGQKVTVMFADKIMALGFKSASKAGISFGKDDMIVPESKNSHINKTLETIKEYEKQYASGFITIKEKYNKVTDVWAECTDRVAADMMKELSKNSNNNKINSIHVGITSGARGSEMQMRQLAGMRGLMTKPSGEIIETPIISNFKEGLTVLEYFNSAHGARKGLADTALKTADSGYLTRRLVDVAQNCIVVEHDCGTQDGVIAKAIIEDEKVTHKLSEFVLGRVSVQFVEDENGKVLVRPDDLINEEIAARLDKAEIMELRVRSVVTCTTVDGVCAKCYGRNLATGDLVTIGEPVGIVAAQSIGEPGTQLTMRTFQIGGVASKIVEKSSLESGYEGIVRFIDVKFVQNRSGAEVVVSNNARIVIVDPSGKERGAYSVIYGAKLIVKEGDAVKRGAQLAAWDPYNIPIISEFSGKVSYEDLTNNLTYRETIDEVTGVINRTITEYSVKNKTMQPKLAILDSKTGEPIKTAAGTPAKYALSLNSILTTNDGDEVKAGDILARLPKDVIQKVADITGGLPRVEEVFEARKPKEPALIAEIDGVVQFTSDYRSKRKLVITPSPSAISQDPVEYIVPKGKLLRVQEGSSVRKGDIIMDGNTDPHDVLKVNGIEAIVNFILDEIQQVFRLQGQKIDNKHIEIIVRYMLQKVEITDAGDSKLLVGTQVDRKEVNAINNSIKRRVRFQNVLQGITKASLQTESFISAASFQETTKVLTEAAIAGKIDKLRGPKENIIVGRLIPAGTGFTIAKLKEEARFRDDKIALERAIEQQNMENMQNFSVSAADDKPASNVINKSGMEYEPDGAEVDSDGVVISDTSVEDVQLDASSSE